MHLFDTPEVLLVGTFNLVHDKTFGQKGKSRMEVKIAEKAGLSGYFSPVTLVPIKIYTTQCII